MGDTDVPTFRSLHEVVDEVIARRVRGEDWTDEQIVQNHPELMPQLQHELRKVRRVEQARLAAVARRAEAQDQASDDFGETAPDDLGEPFCQPVNIDGYEVIRLINHGGQAMIYLARRLSTGQQVALKLLRFGALAGAKQRARFEREAELLAAIKNPHIVSVLDHGVTRDGQLYLAMPYIAGEPLNPEKLAQRATVQERLHLFVTICRAVDAAHQRGIIHRDLKPGNVRLDESGRPHVLDFGLATDRRPDDLRQSMTVTGQFLGSFLWASPEQAQGKSDLTPASDVYSLGVMLHQLATSGRFPPQVFESVKRALDPSGRGGRLAMSGDLHPALATIIARALAPEPSARYETAGALAGAVEHFLAEPESHRRPVRRGLVAALVLLVVIALVAVTVPFTATTHSTGAVVNGRPILHLGPRLSLVWIAPGEFWMGSPLAESERLPDERRHRVRIERGFYMMQTEVPQWLYREVMGSNPSALRSDGGALPVESVTWHDAVAFCEAFSERTGRRVRLPTEAEWEYACRAGSNTKFSFGDDPRLITRYGNFADRSSVNNPKRDRNLDDGCPRTVTVSHFLANRWGLMQMHGNVWEWCLDAYAPYPTADGVSSDHVPAVMSEAPPFVAVARGGSWYDDLSGLRSANRCAIMSTTRESTLGFRIVCEDDAPLYAQP